MTYDRVLHVGGHELRISAAAGQVVIHHDGVMIRRDDAEDMGAGTSTFSIDEGGVTARYDIRLVVDGSGGTHCFVGRDGTLIFSDAPGLACDRTR